MCTAGVPNKLVAQAGCWSCALNLRVYCVCECKILNNILIWLHLRCDTAVSDNTGVVHDSLKPADLRSGRRAGYRRSMQQ